MSISTIIGFCKYGMKMFCGTVAIIAIMLCIQASAADPDWDLLDFTPIFHMQAVNANGSPAWNVPMVPPDDQQAYKIRGVVLHEPSLMLDGDPNYQEGPMWEMGGQWQVFIQAVARPGDTENNPELVDDVGGAALWIGQNYGNHFWHYPDWSYNYSDTEWTAELDRLNLPIDINTGQPVTEPLRPGDLIEIRARGGLHYKGKFNVNEEHENDSGLNFDVVLIERNLALPLTNIELSDVKDANDDCIFDLSRLTGGELYQGRRVQLQNVTIDNPSQWGVINPVTGEYYEIKVTDGTRTFDIILGQNDLFAGTIAPEGQLDIIGIFDQDASAQVLSIDGYQMWALTPDAFLDVDRLPGDANGDGAVDVSDLGVLATNYGAIGIANWVDADFNGDGNVDASDLGILATNYDTTSAAAAPEPGMLALLSGVLIWLLYHGKSRK